MIRLLLSIFLVSCAASKKPSASTPDLFEKLRATYQVKEDRYYELVGKSGWPSILDCDSLLWAGLACSVGLQVDIFQAEYSPGEMHRRPPPSCWTKEAGAQGSKSTISNDMLLGYMWCLYALADLNALERLATYGEEHNWVMGDGDTEALDRVLLRPNNQSLLGRLIYLFDGPSKSYRHIPLVYFPVEKDYEQHLQALSIGLAAQIRLKGRGDNDYGLMDVTPDEFERLKELTKKQPKNPLFRAVYGIYAGDLNPAVKLLLNEENPDPEYVDGDNVEALSIIAWLRAARFVLDHG